jgi:hypothetical protein
MWEQDSAYLDYGEIRRRIEQRLAGATGIVWHMALFLVAILAILMFVIPGQTNGYPYFIEPGVGALFAIWSIVLMLHGARSFRRSGAIPRRREPAIEEEISERVEQGDTVLLEDVRQVFRVRALLNQDIRQRAGILAVINAFLIFNAFVWVMWTLQGATSSYTWQMTIPTAIVFLLPAFALNALRRVRRDRKLARMLAGLDNRVEVPKRKRLLDDEVFVRLSDDGELEEIFEEDYPVRKSKPV